MIEWMSEGKLWSEFNITYEKEALNSRENKDI